MVGHVGRKDDGKIPKSLLKGKVATTTWEVSEQIGELGRRFSILEEVGQPTGL